MMKQAYIVLVALILSATEGNCANVNPRGLEDEIRVQLDELRYMVRGAIFKAMGDVDNSVRDVYIHRDTSIEASRLSIGEHYDTLNGYLVELKIGANASEKDIGPCLKFREELFHRMPQDVIDSLTECLITSNVEVTVINNDALYRIDTLINEVNIFDFQIELCRGEILCLSPVANQIELAMLKIPQTIGVEVVNAQGLFDELKVIITVCGDSKVSHYATEGTALFEAMAECIATWEPGKV